ncbi:MAG: glycosyl transferase family 2 [Acidocella sp. 20-63-7]|nr:MAG: glycosyl transferase family 2 [Acidocella sp. 20-63-7]HQT46816.1 glycosyltransferase [Acidocella sp.]
MPLPAHHLLNPACALKPAWAIFDPAWYLRHHADARVLCAGKPQDAALLYYLRTGARLGHSPSPLFDELFYLARNPDIAELVRAGAYASGFDHFCQQGHRGVSPHWLFDDELYANLHEDMTLENLDQHACYGRYDHYLKSGQFEQRMGHFLFDSTYYRAQVQETGVPEEALAAIGPYVHYLHRLGSGEEELAPSIYFDPAWYVEHHPGAKADIARGRYACAIHHYLTSAGSEYLDPVAQFSESFYRRRHPDIAVAIENGLYRSGYQQFIQYGTFELRQPAAGIDLAYYRDMNEAVRNALNSGAMRDAFAHLRAIGLKDGLAYYPPDEKPSLDEALTRSLFLQKARANLPLFARHKLDFAPCAPPELSVIMVAFNRVELTLQALASLRDNFAGPLELILVDNASTDETRDIGDYLKGAKILRQEKNLGFLRACNIGLAHVTAPALLYLNNDTELAHGAIATALARLRSAPQIGAVGGKIIRTNGLLQEAGSIIWNDGTTTGYLRDASPLAGEANFVREVDYCSAVFLLCRTALVRSLDGFDDAFAPAYFEDADLCVRFLQSGAKIIYDPGVVVHHLEFGSASTTEASMALMRRGRRIFKAKHKDFLSTRPSPTPENLIAARSRSASPAILFIEDTLPLRRLGSGFVRSNDIVHAIAATGYNVHVFPMNGAPYDLIHLYGDLPETAELLHERDFLSLPEFLSARVNAYDLIWIARTHNFTRLYPLLVEAGIKIPIILDTEALAANRAAALAQLMGEGFNLPAALRAEFSGAKSCRKILAVSDGEVAQLQKIGLKSVTKLGTARAPSPTLASFAERDGLLFVAAIHQEDSPNLDALHWAANELLPALAAELGKAPVLHVVGHTAPGIDFGVLRQHKGIKFHGTASDLAPYYNAARVFIAPTRFAAGTPYKIFETAAFGLPCVASSLLGDQLGWRAGQELLSAPVNDAKAFAHEIARLYESEALWTTLRENALARLAAEHSPEAFNASVANILHEAGI